MFDNIVHYRVQSIQVGKGSRQTKMGIKLTDEQKKARRAKFEERRQARWAEQTKRDVALFDALADRAYPYYRDEPVERRNQHHPFDTCESGKESIARAMIATFEKLIDIYDGGRQDEYETASK